MFCLFFYCLDTYGQSVQKTNTYVNLEIGVNYAGNQFGGSTRLSYDLNPSVQVGIEGDYIRGVLYQSSGNGKLGKSFNTKYGSFFTYIISGAGLSFENKVGNSNGLIGIAGIGIGYATKPEFNLFNRFPTGLTFCIEADKYSNIDSLVFKQYAGIRIEF